MRTRRNLSWTKSTLPNDLAYNLLVETRYRRAIVAVHAQSKTTFVKTLRIKKELRAEIISSGTLENLHKLAKVEENYGRNRRGSRKGVAREGRESQQGASVREQTDGGANQDGN
jgi:hypothetical protein